MVILGIDVGGSGVKTALVESTTGEMLTERARLSTPDHPNPQALTATIAESIRQYDWKGPTGIGFPGVIQGRSIRTAVNLDPELVGFDLAGAVEKETGCTCHLVNDADAAGIAEMRLGIGREFDQGVVIMLTAGTGIGSAIFSGGRLLPNSEIGHLLMKGGEAEQLLSKITRKEKDLSWKTWAGRFDRYLHHLASLFWPEAFIIGGGAAKKPERFMPVLTVTERVPVLMAAFGNHAGIIGAALAASENTPSGVAA